MAAAGKAEAPTVEAVVTSGRTVDMRGRILLKAVKNAAGEIVGEPFEEVGRLYGPGETVVLDAEEAERLRLAGFVSIGDAAPVKYAAGPAVLVEDGVSKPVE